MLNKKWRFLDTGEASGALNMAVDEALFRAKEQNPELPPVLRVFRWKPACLSVGRTQDLKRVNLAKCQELRIDLVRRLSGGTAILHKEELTYSIVISQNDGIPFDVITSFRILNQGLIVAYQKLGVRTELVLRQEGEFSDWCFTSHGFADLLYQGKKIVGSAQFKRGKTILQHGTLVIRHEPELMFELLNIGDLSSTTDLETVRGETHWQDIRKALLLGFREAFGIEFRESRLSPQEMAESQRLLTRYQEVA